MTERRIGVLGETGAAALRRASLRRLGADVLDVEPRDAGRVDVLFVASEPALRFAHTLEAVRHGVPVFVEWPPAAALADVQALVAAADEAGVRVGVSRPLRYALDAARPARLVLARQTAPAPLALTHLLADLIDLSRFLTASSLPVRLEAHAERDATRAPQAVAVTLRFQNGACVQGALCVGTEDALDVQAFAGAHAHGTHLAGVPAAALDAETAAFLDAAAARQPVAVPPLDALQTLRLVEKVLARLR